MRDMVTRFYRRRPAGAIKAVLSIATDRLHTCLDLTRSRDGKPTPKRIPSG
jgi:hypothetical protein